MDNLIMPAKQTRNRKQPSYIIGDRLHNHAVPRQCEQQIAQPSARPLRIFTLDPSVSDRVGGVATVHVPYESLKPGPRGAVFEFDPTGAPKFLGDTVLDLDDPVLLRTSGLSPTPASARFHMQMAYAVCSMTHAAFRRALGRDIDWACGIPDDTTGQRRLRVRPFAFQEDNAYYDRAENGLVFGFFRARRAPAGHTVPGGMVFTGLSHDVLVHETTHALLDALRSEFWVPSHPDVLGFHEGFADIIALLQHFSYPDVVEHAIRESRGSLSRAELLTNIAREFGHALSDTEAPSPLRVAVDLENITAFDSDAPVPNRKGRRGLLQYKPHMEEHDMGAVLLSAVFEAFVTIFRRKTERYFRIAGIAGDGTALLSTELVKVLAQEASDIAGRFLDICIRAIDYCPPVDIEIGEYLRALITADSDMVAHDKWGYREALMRSFRRRRLFPSGVEFMSEDAVRWHSATNLRARGLSFRELHFNGDPGSPADQAEMLRQAHALGAFVSDPETARALHLYLPDMRVPRHMSAVTPPRVDSVRCARRVTPDGRVLFDLVAEVTQSCLVRHERTRFRFDGGCTLVIDPCGNVRYAVYKKLDSAVRQERQARAIRGPLRQHWTTENGTRVPALGMLKRLHTRRERRLTPR